MMKGILDTIYFINLKKNPSRKARVLLPHLNCEKDVDCQFRS